MYKFKNNRNWLRSLSLVGCLFEQAKYGFTRLIEDLYIRAVSKNGSISLEI